MLEKEEIEYRNYLSKIGMDDELINEILEALVKDCSTIKFSESFE